MSEQPPATEPPTPEEDPRLKLVYEEALRSNAQQQAVLESIHARTATLISAAAISTAFLGAQALDDGSGIAGILATMAFVASEFMAIRVLWPRDKKWMFRFNTKNLLRDYVDDTPMNLDDMRAVLAGHLEDNFASNKDGLDVLFFRFRWAAALLMIEVFLWLIELGWG